MIVDWSKFRRAATMTQASGGVAVDIVDDEAAGWAEAVYAWVDGSGNPLRIGTCDKPVGSRLRQYARHINRSLAGAHKPTPLWEAEMWLAKVNSGTLFAVVHRPDLIKTVAGELRPFLDVERRLIRELRPSLNRSHR